MWFVFNSLLLVASIFKLMFFLRVNQTFGMLVQLVLQVVLDFRHFLFFMIVWIIAFSFLYRVSGIEVPLESDGTVEYNDLNTFIVFAI